MGKSNISYLDHVWNPITGCSGKGCQAHCYAREIVRRFPAIHDGYEFVQRGDFKDQTPVPFNRVVFHPDRLAEPLKRKKPTVWGVGFFGDWMDDQVQENWLVSIFATILKCPQHDFVTLTKQSKNLSVRLAKYHPLPNVWHGLTVCTQAEADEKIPDFLKVPGKKWISIEPMLGPVDLKFPAGANIYNIQLPDGFDGWIKEKQEDWFQGQARCTYITRCSIGIDLVILGGESGPKARPMHPDWARSVRDQCAAANVPFVFKQWGEWVPEQPATFNGPFRLRAREWAYVRPYGQWCSYGDYRPEFYADNAWWWMARVGTKAAGRLLDGIEHNELPWRRG